MITIPNTAHFGGVQYSVLLSEEPLLHPWEDGVYLNGACLPSKKAIIVYNDPNCPTGVEETLLHEVIEGILDTYDIEMSHQTIKTVGVALHQFLAMSKIDWSQSAVHGMVNTTTH